MSGGLAGFSTRHQLAAYSPITLHALVAGARALAGGGATHEHLCGLLCARFDAGAAMLTGSGTQALQVAMQVARTSLGTDASIALPAFGCYDLASAAVGAGGSVHLYDVDPGTLAPDVDSLEQVMAAGARVVVIAPLYGVPVPWELLEASARRFGAILIEDAAQGHGAVWRNRPLGNWGRLSVLSFGRGKGWTGGTGGALLVRGGTSADGAMLEAARGSLSTALALAAQAVLGRPSVYGLPRRLPFLGLGETVYHAPSSPRRMTAVAAGVVRATEAASDAEAWARRRNAAALSARLREYGVIRMISVDPDASPGYLRLPLRLSGGWRSIGADGRASRLGLAPSYPMVLRDVSALASQLAGVERSYPGAEALVAELVTAPTHSLVRGSEHDAIVAFLGGFSIR